MSSLKKLFRQKNLPVYFYLVFKSAQTFLHDEKEGMLFDEFC